MTEQEPKTMPVALAELDSALAELTALRRRVAELQSHRDEWRARSEWR